MPEAPHQPAPEQHNSAMNLLAQLPVACWSLIIDRLSVADLVALAASSREVAQLLQAPGLLLQACSSHLGWPPAAACRTRAPPAPATSAAAACKLLSCKHAHGQRQRLQEQEQASSNHAAGDAGWQPWQAAVGATTATSNDDACAWQAATSMAAVAHACSHSIRPRFRPQAFPIPPWLSVQPGRARGFARVQADSLSPSLVLGEAETAWLALGSLAGHAGGVFTSACSSSPRSQMACGFVAAVVINKALVAEVYLPAGCGAPDRWGSLLTAATPAGDSSCTAAGQQQLQQQEEGEEGSSGAFCEGPAQQQQQQQQRGVQLELWLASSVLSLPPEQPAAAAAAGSSRRRRGPAGSTAAAGAGVVTWPAIHALLMGCVRDNAARSRAVRCTAFVPPGTAAASDLEQRLARLLQAGAPVLDLRRCSFLPASPAERQQQQQARGRQRQRAGAAGMLAVQQATAALTLHNQQDDAACTSSCSSSGGDGGGCVRLSQLAAARLAWRQVAASVQAALSAAVAAQLAAHTPNTTITSSSSSSSSSSSGQQCLLTDDAMGEALAALVQQLPLLAPGLQLLVLPVLLPGGRAAGVRLAGGSSGSRGTRLSAPRLLSLNVSFLIPLRAAWDRLPQLRQVLLMLHSSSSSSSSSSGPAVSGSSSSDVVVAERVAGTAAGGQRLLRGVFSLQALEQQWQQAAAGSGQQQQPGCKGGQSAEDAALDEIVNADAGGCDEYAGDSGEQLQDSSGCGVEPTTALTLPQTAVEAVHGMLLSCMDRCSDAVLLGSA